MKSSIACFASAVSKLNKNKKFKGSISFLITGDEEDMQLMEQKVVKYLKKKREKIDFCIGEPTNPKKLVR